MTNLCPERHGERGSALWITLAVVLALALVVFGLLHWANDHGDVEPLRPTVTSGTSESARASTRAHEPAGAHAQPAAAGSDTDHAAVEAPRSDSDAWRIAGIVHGRGAAPVAGAVLHVTFEIAGDVHDLGTAHSAADGSFALDAQALGSLDPISASMCRVSATAEAEHHAPARTSVPFDARAPDRTVHVDVQLSSGERLTGRVVDARSKPVPLATVRFSVARVQNGATSWSLLEERTTDPNGRFEMGFTSSGRAHLAVRADGIGTAFVGDLELEAGSPRDLGDLALAGGEPIAGTVVHIDGQPAQHFEVWAFDGDYAGEPDGLALAVRKAAEDERGDGLLTTRSTTDAQGRFSLRGLRPGHYVLRSADPRATLEPHQARFDPGAAHVELQLQSYSLVVSVIDEDGAPVRGANVRLSALSTLPDGTHEPTATRTLAAQGPGAVASFCVDPQAPYALDAYTPGARSAEELVVVSLNEYVRATRVVLPRRPAMGRIRLDVQGEDGRPLEALQVALFASVTHARLEDVGELEPDEHGLLPPVPCGTYDALVGYAAGTDRFHFPVRTTTPITVTSGDPVRVSLHPHRGGRIRLTITLDGPAPAGFADEPPPAAGIARRAAFAEDRRARFGVAVALVRHADASTHALQFQRDGATALDQRLLPGETATSWDLIEADTYDVTVESATVFDRAPLQVTIVAGQTVAASLRLRAP